MTCGEIAHCENVPIIFIDTQNKLFVDHQSAAKIQCSVCKLLNEVRFGGQKDTKRLQILTCGEIANCEHFPIIFIDTQNKLFVDNQSAAKIQCSVCRMLNEVRFGGRKIPSVYRLSPIYTLHVNLSRIISHESNNSHFLSISPCLFR